MQKYKKPDYDVKKLGKNPFSFTLQIPVREITFKDQYTKDKNGILLPVVAEAEYTPFVRLYSKSDLRKTVAGMPSSAKELLLWIMYEIKHGEDFLWINKDRFMVENKTSLNTYKKALQDLIRYGFLAISVVKDIYWINPEYFFKGDRIAKYPDNVVMMNKEKE